MYLHIIHTMSTINVPAVASLQCMRILNKTYIIYYNIQRVSFLFTYFFIVFIGRVG